MLDNKENTGIALYCLFIKDLEKLYQEISRGIALRYQWVKKIENYEKGSARMRSLAEFYKMLVNFCFIDSLKSCQDFF